MIIVKSTMRLVLLVGVWALIGAGSLFAAKAPAWLAPLISDEATAAEKKAGSVVLWDEARYDFNERGVQKEFMRWAVKIYDRKDRDRAIASLFFEEGFSKITGFRAWMVEPNGKVYKYAGKDTFDVASDLSTLHSSTMLRELDLSDDVREGCVFAFEYARRRNTVFSQIQWYLNQSVSVRKSVLSVTPPSGWGVKMIALNGAQVEERRSGEAYVWEALDLEAIEHEANGPVSEALRPKLGISLVPSEKADRTTLQTFANWNDIACYDAQANDPQIEPDDAIRAKVDELCAGLSSDWEKLNALGAYAQSVNYVSVQTNLSIGGGYKPFKAAEVFARHYGDCKDKTALMRSMLSCIGMESYAVSADIGDGCYVEPAWPTLHQFNHCIVAIPVAEDISCDAVVKDEQLGRVLLFDPTSEYTPMGKLTRDLPGSYVLIGSEKVQALTAIPPTTPQQNRVEREVEVNLAESGEAVGVLKEISSGRRALQERSFYKRKTETEYQEMLTRWISSAGSNGEVVRMSFEDAFQENRTELQVEFYLPVYARSMRGKYLVFKPFQLNQMEAVAESDSPRKQPYIMKAYSSKELVKVSVPEGFQVDDFMKPVLIETDFARYEALVEKGKEGLRCVREVELRESVVPANRYQEVVDFFKQVARSEQSPVVLAVVE